MHSVLVVENGRKWERMFLQKLNRYQVQSVSDWGEAVRRLERTEFDAVVLNLHLEEEKDFLGEEVLAAIVRYSPLTPCILVSGYPDQLVDMFHRYGEQIYQFLSKGIGRSQFDFKKYSDTVGDAIKARAKARKLLTILDEHLTDDECELVQNKLTDYYRIVFKVPGDLSSGTKKQKLGYMIARLVHMFKESAIYTLCDIAKEVRPGDRSMNGKLGQIYPARARPKPAKLDSQTVNQLTVLIKANKLQEALDILATFDGYRREAISLSRRLIDLEESRRRKTISRHDYDVEINQIVEAISDIIYT